MDLSAGALVASMFVSTAGFGVFHYGRKQARAPQLVGGMAMMVAPYLVSGVAGILAAGVVLALATWTMVRVGG